MAGRKRSPEAGHPVAGGPEGGPRAGEEARHRQGQLTVTGAPFWTAPLHHQIDKGIETKKRLKAYASKKLLGRGIHLGYTLGGGGGFHLINNVYFLITEGLLRSIFGCVFFPTAPL